jgi:hypothetical protein
MCSSSSSNCYQRLELRVSAVHRRTTASLRGLTSSSVLLNQTDTALATWCNALRRTEHAGFYRTIVRMSSTHL